LLALPWPQRATGPVHAVLSENAAVYHFWSSEARRWEVASLELYDASPVTLKWVGPAQGGSLQAGQQCSRLKGQPS
jgi:hypothetical protein